MSVFYEYSLYFFIYSILGFILETSYVSIVNKKFIYRGFLNGPYCPIYGVGMAILIFCVQPFMANVFLLFLMGGLVATVVELVTGSLMETLFKTRWWDYSDNPFNYKGYICLKNTLYWCFLTVIVFKFIHIHIANWILSFNLKTANIAVYSGWFILIIDTTVTIINTLKLSEKLKNMEVLTKELNEKIEELINNSKLKEDYQEFQNRLKTEYEGFVLTKNNINGDFNNIVERIKANTNDYRNKIKEIDNNISDKVEELVEKINNNVKETKEKLNSLKEDLDNKYTKEKKTNIIQKRLIKAFPNIKSKKLNDYLEEIKKQIKK